VVEVVVPAGVMSTHSELDSVETLSVEVPE
jgi:hypothetical protein